MGQPAARLTDMHVCPLFAGPVIGPCVPTVKIGSQPAAVLGDQCTCLGDPDAITAGSPTVLIGGKPAARLGDPTAKGGALTTGWPTVLIGNGAGDAGAARDCLATAADKGHATIAPGG